MTYTLNTCLGLLRLFLVVALAFLLASFPVRNSDVWLHLARGRLLAQGVSPSTLDPDLAFDLLGNQTWLYDWISYSCYRVLGETGLVFGKALLAAGMALLLLRTSRSALGWSVPAVCTSLALLTMSLYLLLQPAMASYLFLALVLACLQVGTLDRSEGCKPPERSLRGFTTRAQGIFLLLLFVVWANVDRCFLLGLGVVALVWAGEGLDAVFPSGLRASARLLLRRGFFFGFLAAACLLNPSPRHTFVLAEEFRRWGPTTGQVLSPFERAYFAKFGSSPAGLAYFFLLGLSLLSFLAVLPHWRWRRFLPWLGLALLSAWQARTIPFFAIVAGPVLAWNIQDILVCRFQWGQTNRTPGLLRLGQTLTTLLLLVLVVCAWPGWLQTPPFGPRRWAFDLPPALERGAAAVRRWHEEGKLTADSGGLHLSAETVYAFAWFCPTEKRLRLTAQGSAEQWRSRMRAAGIQYVLVYDTDRDRLAAALGGLVADPEQWPLLWQEGDLAIFGWRDPDLSSGTGGAKEKVERFRGWQLDLNRLAFHPAEDKKAPAEAPAPQAERPWWEVFWKAAPLRSIDRDEALFHLLHAEALERLAPLRHLRCWQNSQTAGLLGAAGAWTSPPHALYETSFRLALLHVQAPQEGPASVPSEPPGLTQRLAGLAVRCQRRLELQCDDAPPALYYLAVRAARRAVAANPEDASAYLLLGESYLGLLHATRERAWGTQLHQLVQLRQAQASAALNRALALRPDFLQAHLHLSRLYQEMGYLDLALTHGRSACQLARQAGPPAGVSPKEFQASQDQMEKQIERLAQEVQKRADAATLASTDSPIRQRAFAAFQNGLAAKALEILLESHVSAFGSEGMELELELLLGVGRPWDVRQWLRPEHQNELGLIPYYWLRVRAAAACGEYARAEEECAEAAHALVRGPDNPQALRLREKMALEIATLMLNEPRSPNASFANLLAHYNEAVLAARLQDQAQQLRQQADWTVLGGLLALEEGETEEARLAFRAALSLWKDKATAAKGGGLDFNSRMLAQSCLRWLEETSSGRRQGD